MEIKYIYGVISKGNRTITIIKEKKSEENVDKNENK